jgi:hypothetical protein
MYANLHFTPARELEKQAFRQRKSGLASRPRLHAE